MRDFCLFDFLIHTHTHRQNMVSIYPPLFQRVVIAEGGFRLPYRGCRCVCACVRVFWLPAAQKVLLDVYSEEHFPSAHTNLLRPSALVFPLHPVQLPTLLSTLSDTRTSSPRGGLMGQSEGAAARSQHQRASKNLSRVQLMERLVN